MYGCHNHDTGNYPFYVYELPFMSHSRQGSILGIAICSTFLILGAELEGA